MKNLFPLKLTKMSGAGNTFVLVDARTKSSWPGEEMILKKSRSELARLFCDKVFGLGVDGVLFIQDGGGDFDYEWDFYNSDGSSAEMCGNAARCAARFCSEELSNGSLEEIRFKTAAGLISTTLLDSGKIRVVMPEAHWIQKQRRLSLSKGQQVVFDHVNTGVPHLVQKVQTIESVGSLRDMAREARNHLDLSPQGSNVTFYAEQGPGKIRAVTFERGVEDYTLACGTGAVAAAMVHSAERALSQVEVTMPGGVIEVDFAEDRRHPTMTGDATFVGEFQYNFEVLR